MARFVPHTGASLAFAAVVLLAPPTTAQTPDSGRALLDRYCVTCHSDSLRTGGLSLEGVDPANPAHDVETFEKVILKLRSGMMPPEGRPRPPAGTSATFVSELEAGIDRVAAAHPNPGRPILHRLNRTEYANAVRDLLDLEVDPSSLLPPDDMSQGFDNMSDVLTISPTLLESYLVAAGKITRLAVGDPDAAPVVETYVVPPAFSQMRHVPGAPFGTRGGLAVRHTFPADGDYVFRLSFYFASIGALFGDNMPAEGEQIEIAVNGARVALLDIDRKMRTTDVLRTPPIPVKAGPQMIAAAFVQRAAGPVQDFVMPFEQALADLSTGHFPGLTGLPHLRNLGIDGPHDVTGVSDTPSRQRIFVCRPAERDSARTCAREILGGLARRAYRRPVGDDDLALLESFYDAGHAQGGTFDAGIRLGLQSILADPEFLFRFERTPPSVAAGTNHPISDLELASRLSFFLWSSIPDDVLLDVAIEGRLSEPAELARQVRRMLADPRSQTLATNFASHWLHLQNLDDVQPDVYLFPDWDLNLIQSMRRETELLFDGIVRNDRAVTELLTADYTFVDERLATHYGIPDVVGNRFRRVPVADDRRGLLGHGSILTLTSLANRTSPVIRGSWIMDVLLGAPPPRPPANVPPLAENERGGLHLSMRARLAAHRESPACAACHRIMDPVGFSLENFDAVGAWRTKDSGADIDPSEALFDGSGVHGPAGIREYLVRSETLFVRNFTRKLLMYALGRILRSTDMSAVRGVAQAASADDNRFSAFVMGIVRSAPFATRRAEATDAAQ